MQTAAEGFPKHSFSQLCSEYHDKSKTVLRAAFAAAREAKQKQNDGEEVTFEPPSNVTHSMSRVVKVSVQAAFLTESEVVKAFGVSSRTLRLGKPVPLQVEDASLAQGFLISMKGMPENVARAFRIVTTEFVSTNVLSETLMQAQRQIRKEQGTETWEVACSQQELQLPPSLKSTARHNMCTYEALLGRAQEIVEASKGSQV